MVDQPDRDKSNDELAQEYLRHIATRGLGNTDFEDSEPRWGTARFGARMNLVITVRGGDKSFVFDAGEIEEIIIGRLDPQSQEQPEVDLEPFGGTDKGVSRKHATIVRRDGSLNIVNNGSHNGTYLNGQRLVANQARILRDGDDLRLGHLTVRINFQRA